MAADTMAGSVVDSSERLGRRVLFNFLALLGGRGVSLLLSAASSILVARCLGTQLVGQYGALYAYVSLFGWLATFGIEPIMGREAASRREMAGAILTTGTFVAFCFSVLAGALSLLLAPRFGYSGYLRLLMIIAAIDLLVLTPLRLPAFIFQVDLVQWKTVGITLQRQILWLAAVAVLAVARRLSLLYVVLGRLACSVFEIVLMFWGSRRLLRPPRQFVPGLAGLLVSGGLPIAFSALAVTIYHRIDQVMLHNMVGDAALGYYVVAVNITELFSAIPLALMSPLFPVLSQSASQPGRFREVMRVSFRCMMVCVFGICILVSLCAGPLVSLLYGPAFLPSATYLRLLVWSEIPVFFGVVLANGMIAANLQKFLPFSTAAGAILNVVLNLYLIPRWGVAGAVWATVVSYSAAEMFLLWLFQDLRPMTGDGLGITLAAAVPAFLALALVWFSSFPLELKLPVALGVYGLGIAFTQPGGRNELVWLYRGLVPATRSTAQASAIPSSAAVVWPSHDATGV